MKPKFKPVSPKDNLVALEEQTLKYWQEEKVFEQSVKGEKNFSFYDGPPFATGLPHYGHLLAGVLKDVVPRFQTMNRFKVERRFGWDCHGLPVEAEVQKKLGLFSRKDVLKFGVDKFNEECRRTVLRYTSEWKTTVHRLGRFVDMDRPYHTMDVDFMQSVWWVFKELYQKGLVYEGFKVVPYSVGLGSVLSNFEANQRYEDVQDVTLTVKFKLKEKPWTLLAWTTTPWTLPMNAALAVNPEVNYSVVDYNGELLVVASQLVSSVFKNLNYKIQEEFKGQKLLGLTYVPVFPQEANNAYQVVAGEYVTEESGTGVVHTAPAFGEDDFQTGKKYNLPLFNFVDDDGVYTKDLPEFAGHKSLDSNDLVYQSLKAKNLVFKKDTYLHSYPHCYRTGTKLMYRAVSSWFVKVESLKDKLVENNKKTSWQPEHLRDGRFGNWLEQARDWAVSRNRFWGTPLPLWSNEEGEVVCVGSLKELEELSGQKLTDLHSHHVGHLELPSPTGKSNLKWVGGVLDCWFESGAMPYAQFGYPHKEGSLEKLADQFPANFVAEGLDQTRGWFYTLMVLGTALFDQAPFKQVVVNGLVLAEDGKKMSKMLKNYPDPMEVLNTCGADALRLYLLDSPVVMSEELKFSVKGVQEQVRKILLRLHNVHSFLVGYALADNYTPQYVGVPSSNNLLDKWLLSRLDNLVTEVANHMNDYQLNLVVPLLSQFVEDLTNSYVRFNRTLFWQQGMPSSKLQAYDTLHFVLVEFSKVLAPFAPFMAENLWQNLNREEGSVHLQLFPEFKGSFVDKNLEESVKVMTDLVELGRNYREQVKVKTKVPLKSVVVVHRSDEVLANLKLLENYFQEELNVRAVQYSNQETNYVSWSVKPNFPVVGKRLGPKLPLVTKALQALSSEAVATLVAQGEVTVLGEKLTLAELMVVRRKLQDLVEVCVNPAVVLVFNPEVSEEQLLEGEVREVLRKVQEMRKTLGLQLTDRVNLELTLPENLLKVFPQYEEMVKLEALVDSLNYSPEAQGDLVVHMEPQGVTLGLRQVPA